MGRKIIKSDGFMDLDKTFLQVGSGMVKKEDRLYWLKV